MERPEERVAEDAEERVRERAAREAVAAARVVPLPGERHRHDERDEDRGVPDENDRDPRAYDEAKHPHETPPERLRRALARVAPLPRLGEALRKEVHELALARDPELATVLRRQPLQAALGVAERQTRLGGGVGDRQRRARIDPRADRLARLGGGHEASAVRRAQRSPQATR